MNRLKSYLILACSLLLTVPLTTNSSLPSTPYLKTIGAHNRDQYSAPVRPTRAAVHQHQPDSNLPPPPQFATETLTTHSSMPKKNTCSTYLQEPYQKTSSAQSQDQNLSPKEIALREANRRVAQWLQSTCTPHPRSEPPTAPLTTHSSEPEQAKGDAHSQDQDLTPEQRESLKANGDISKWLKSCFTLVASSKPPTAPLTIGFSALHQAKGDACSQDQNLTPGQRASRAAKTDATNMMSRYLAPSNLPTNTFATTVKFEEMELHNLLAHTHVSDPANDPALIAYLKSLLAMYDWTVRRLNGSEDKPPTQTPDIGQKIDPEFAYLNSQKIRAALWRLERSRFDSSLKDKLQDHMSKLPENPYRRFYIFKETSQQYRELLKKILNSQGTSDTEAITPNDLQLNKLVTLMKTIATSFGITPESIDKHANNIRTQESWLIVETTLQQITNLHDQVFSDQAIASYENAQSSHDGLCAKAQEPRQATFMDTLYKLAHNQAILSSQVAYLKKMNIKITSLALLNPEAFHTTTHSIMTHWATWSKSSAFNVAQEARATLQQKITSSISTLERILTGTDANIEPTDLCLVAISRGDRLYRDTLMNEIIMWHKLNRTECAYFPQLTDPSYRRSKPRRDHLQWDQWDQLDQWDQFFTTFPPELGSAFCKKFTSIKAAIKNIYDYQAALGKDNPWPYPQESIDTFPFLAFYPRLPE